MSWWEVQKIFGNVLIQYDLLNDIAYKAFVNKPVLILKNILCWLSDFFSKISSFPKISDKLVRILDQKCFQVRGPWLRK